LSDVRAILLDLGGVLVEVEWSRAFRLWSERSGVPAAELAKRFRRDAAYEAHECGTLGDRDFFASLNESLGLRLAEKDLLEGWNAILGEPFPGVAALVRKVAAKLPVYVFSNTNTAHVTHFTPRYRELFAPVRKMIYSCELGHRKPSREAFTKVAEQIGVAPAGILFLDDLEENVEGAKAAGLQARHVPSPEALAPILAPWT
jgi:HAD superfamily hydrolase (TIGR01509 family)